MEEAYLGVDIGSISTKGVIIDKNYRILASEYIWTEGDPMGAARKLIELLEKQFDKEKYQIVATGTTGSARKLVGAMLGATMVKNEITAHAVGTTTLYPDVRTILEIGGQDSKIILVENGVAVDYAMNTLCAAGTGSFLSSQAKRSWVWKDSKISANDRHDIQHLRSWRQDVRSLRNRIWCIRSRWAILKRILLPVSAVLLSTTI